jgi:hypothetical protein
VVVVAQMSRHNILVRIMVVVAVIMIVVVLERITIATVTIMATEESVLLIPEVPLMILGHLWMMIIWLTATIMVPKGLGWMMVNAGLIILHVLLLPHLLGGPLVTVVAMIPIICLVAAVGSLDGSHLGG